MLISLRSRFIALAAVILSVIGVYFYTVSRSSGGGNAHRPSDQEWYSKAVVEFSKLSFASLDTSQSAEAAIGALIAQRCPGDDVGLDTLARDVARVLRALGSPSPEEYVSRNPLRQFKSGSRIDRQGYSWWERCFGASPPVSVGAVEAYTRLAASCGPSRRPREIAEIGRVQVLLGSAEPRRRTSYPRFQCPAPLRDRVGVSNGGTGEPCLTTPSTTIEQAAAAQPQVPFCTLSVILRGADMKPYMISILLYHVTAESAWHVASLADDSTWPPICLPF